MKRFVLALLFALVFSAVARADGPALEIGYVEGFDHAPEAYAIERDGGSLPVSILTPLHDGDIVRIKDPAATISLRLIDQADPIVLSAAGDGTRLHATPPEKSFWTGLFPWTATSLDIFDHEERQQVSASIRGDEKKELAIPLLAVPQTIVAGRRPLAIGWVSPRAVQIRILSRAGKPVAAGKGAGGLWTSPPIDWKPGSYRIEIASAAGKLTQTLVVAAPAAMPKPPAELADDAAPAPLRALATAAWYAATDPRYGLEALQAVAADAPRSQPAKLLALAIIDGRRPPPPPVP